MMRVKGTIWYTGDLRPDQRKKAGPRSCPALSFDMNFSAADDVDNLGEGAAALLHSRPLYYFEQKQQAGGGAPPLLGICPSWTRFHGNLNIPGR